MARLTLAVVWHRSISGTSVAIEWWHLGAGEGVWAEESLLWELWPAMVMLWSLTGTP